MIRQIIIDWFFNRNNILVIKMRKKKNNLGINLWVKTFFEIDLTI